MATEVKEPKSRFRHTTITIDPGTLARLRKIADWNNTTIAGYLRHLSFRLEREYQEKQQIDIFEQLRQKLEDPELLKPENKAAYLAILEFVLVIGLMQDMNKSWPDTELCQETIK